MTTVNPDKEIRKSVFTLTNNIVVSGKDIKTFDSRVTGNADLNEYILLTAQTKEVDKGNKCSYSWETSLLIEIYTRTTSAGNSGSRVLLNDIEERVMTLLNPKITVAGFTTVTQNISYENELETVTDTHNIFRSFLRLNLILD